MLDGGQNLQGYKSYQCGKGSIFSAIFQVDAVQEEYFMERPQCSI
jgi:hypothetical protein